MFLLKIKGRMVGFTTLEDGNGRVYAALMVRGNFSADHKDCVVALVSPCPDAVKKLREWGRTISTDNVVAASCDASFALPVATVNDLPIVGAFLMRSMFNLEENPHY